MHPDQFLRMSAFVERAAKAKHRVGVHKQSGVGCIQFQAVKQMALEIADYTADFRKELILICHAPCELKGCTVSM